MKILVDKVPESVAIGGNLVENWCPFDERNRKSLSLARLCLVRRNTGEMRLISSLFECG
ncbi:MAG: hypothetical protein HY325_00750 [Chloroflexi bacterium]|nr:hypothetical protein [Chloroflexota bacterium]